MKPLRIASLLASSTEMLYALGLGDRVVAVSHECDYPSDACSKPRVTFANVSSTLSSREIDDVVRERTSKQEPLYGIDAELLSSLAPEVIVTQSQCDVCAVRFQDVLDLVQADPRLRQTRVVSLNPSTLQGIFDDILMVGRATDSEAEAQRFVAELEARVERIRGRVSDVPAEDRPRVACIEWIEPLMIGANWVPELVEIAGGRYDLATAGRHSTYTNWSDVTAYDPQIVVIMPCGLNLERTLAESSVLFQLEGWADLSAVKAGRVWAVDGNAYFNRSGPRMVDSLEILAHLLYPDRFPVPLLGVPASEVFCRLERR